MHIDMRKDYFEIGILQNVVTMQNTINYNHKMLRCYILHYCILPRCSVLAMYSGLETNSRGTYRSKKNPNKLPKGSTPFTERNIDMPMEIEIILLISVTAILQV